jgi:hypothetical protein
MPVRRVLTQESFLMPVRALDICSAEEAAKDYDTNDARNGIPDVCQGAK